MHLEPKLCYGAEAAGLRGEALRGPEVLDAQAEVGARSIKATAGAGGLPAQGCGAAERGL